MNRLLLVFAVIATSSFALQIEQNYSDTIRNAWYDCRPTNMTEQTFKDMTEGHKPPTTRDEKCFLYCLSKELGHMNGNTVNSQAVKDSNKKIFTDANDVAKVNGMWDKCLSTVGTKDDECETSAALTLCFKAAIVGGDISLPTMAPPGSAYKYNK